jgi:hypothetical protein
MTDIPLPPENEMPGYFWPGWISRISKNRTLAYLAPGKPEESRFVIVTERALPAIETFYCDSLAGIYAMVFGDDLLTFVESILDLPFLEEAKVQYKAVIYCTRQGIPTALQLHGKKGGHACTRWLICSASWQQLTPNLTLLHRLRTLFDHCGVGTANTPAGLGMALQKRAFYETYGDTWTAHKHPLPPYRCVEDLRAMSTGARSDLLAETTLTFDTVYELDMKNGYAAAFIEQPTGPTIGHDGRFLEQYATYTSQCSVTISTPLVLGCFPVRTVEGQEANISYPTAAGTYETFLWKEEIELVRVGGCIVEPGPGWGWLQMTRDNARFAQLMTTLRDTAVEEIADWIKLAIVASIGRHGSSWLSTTLVPEGEQEPGDLEASWNGLAYDWYIHSAMSHIPETMQHWFSYTLMQCRLELYRYALPYAVRGELLATNTDGIFVRGESDVRSVIPKEEAKGHPAGTWRKSKLSQVSFPALRHIVSNEKVRRPGVPREEKNDANLGGEERCTS